MQIKDNLSNADQSVWLFLIKLLLVGGCMFFVFSTLQSRSINLHLVKWPMGFPLTLLFVTILMIVNWSLEALRWKFSLKPYESVSFYRAVGIVVAGLSMNWVMPFTSGDVVARLLSMRDKYKTVSAILLNRGIMMAITLIYGTYGTLFFLGSLFSVKLMAVAVLLLVATMVFFFRRKLDQFLDYFKNLDTTIIFLIIGLSLLRYAVFILQFFILLSLFLPDISPHLICAGIGWIFLIRSFLPTLMGGVGIRETSGILFFSPLVSDLSLVIIPIFVLWVINIVFPSLIGIVSVWKLKLNIAK